ncbi:MAG: transcriptional repressor [Acidobacteriota bacterium]|jgi:Fur family ferric uptake transcriptional regulator
MKKAGPHRKIISEHCERWTIPREEIFGLLMQSQQHLSAKEVYALLHPSNSAIGIATVYRRLDLLEKAGLLRKIQCRDGQLRYEYKRGDQSDHHHHLICTNCGKILNYRDFEKEELDLVRKTEEIMEKKYGFLVRDHNIEFLGLCKECRPGGQKFLAK